MVHHFVFVHGASHGGWCWFKLCCMLQNSGHKTTPIDLQGAGINITDPNTVWTLDQYNEPLYDFLSQLPRDEKVILVGHSIGGGSITAAMCKFAEKISIAVYIAALMVKPGFPSPLEKWDIKDHRFEYFYKDEIDHSPTAMIMKPELIHDNYYNESPLADTVLASSLLRPAPCRAFEEVTSLPPTPAIDKIPRVYMKTTKDHMFPWWMQDAIILFWKPSKIYTLEGSDHSAFLSVPGTVYDCLLDAASSLLE